MASMQSDEWKAASAQGDDKTWKLLEKAVLAGVVEQRRAQLAEQQERAALLEARLQTLRALGA